MSAFAGAAKLSRLRGLSLEVQPKLGVSARMTANKPAKDFIFVSYSRNDNDVVGRVAGALEARNIDLWLDIEDIAGASFWSEKIVDAIQNSAGVLLLLSPDSASSDNVSKELSIALEEHKPILPVYLEPTELSNRLRYQLTGIQYIEMHGIDDVDRLDEIAGVLRSLIEGGKGEGPTPVRSRHRAGRPASARPSMRWAALVLGALAILAMLGYGAYQSGLFDVLPVTTYEDISLVMYSHDSGLTRAQAEQIRDDLRVYGLTVNVVEHRDRSSPDAVFIGDFVPAKIARKVLDEVPYRIDYLFPNNYSATEGGDPSGLTIGIGYMSGHNWEHRSQSSIPVSVSPADIRHLTEVGISDNEFQKRLRKLILHNPRYPQ